MQHDDITRSISEYQKRVSFYIQILIDIDQYQAPTYLIKDGLFERVYFDAVKNTIDNINAEIEDIKKDYPKLFP